MNGLKRDVRDRNLAPAKVHVVDGGRIGPAKWPLRRKLLFIVLSCVILWSLIGIGLSWIL